MVAHRTPIVLALSIRDIDKALDAIEVILHTCGLLVTGCPRLQPCHAQEDEDRHGHDE
jgi:hypothetical protein